MSQTHLKTINIEEKHIISKIPNLPKPTDETNQAVPIHKPSTHDPSTPHDPSTQPSTIKWKAVSTINH